MSEVVKWGNMTIALPAVQPGVTYSVKAPGDGYYYLPVAPPLLPDPLPVPEAMCPNCRMDRHDFPLTQNMAQMWRSCYFDPDYDPDADVSGVVCPGSDCCGPAAEYRRDDGWGGPGMGPYPFSETFVAPWQITYPPIAWQVIVGESPAQKTLKKLADLKDTLKWLAGLTDWLPADKGTVQQAALEAAPKPIEHNPPASPGFDFSGWNGKPYYYTHMKGKKK